MSDMSDMSDKTEASCVNVGRDILMRSCDWEEGCIFIILRLLSDAHRQRVPPAHAGYDGGEGHGSAAVQARYGQRGHQPGWYCLTLSLAFTHPPTSPVTV